MLTRGTLVYIGQRLVLIALSVLGVSSFVFLAIHRLPGSALFSEHLHGTQFELLLHHYGLDKPLWQQYLSFIQGMFLHGDLGESLVNRGLPITPLVLREMSVSAEVGMFALIFTIGLGMLLGIVAAVRQNTWVDYVLSSTSVVGYSMPNFVIATFLILVFAVWMDNLTQHSFYFQIGWTGRYGTIGEIWLPAFALGFPYASIVARLTRASMLEVIRQDYIRTARAKGVRETVIMVRHALRNALIPVITILGPLVIGIITGGVVIENIFGIPGLGKEFATSILNRDYNIVIGVFTGYAALVGLANLGVDLLYVVIDPRIRY
ncbi:MAG TPA: ABC transporter permease [Candidatus Dormibacteraeota bacterium]|nr:ABC transporter permease [Candidatus Dormibacteraeota bacterium]